MKFNAEKRINTKLECFGFGDSPKASQLTPKQRLIISMVSVSCDCFKLEWVVLLKDSACLSNLFRLAMTN